MLQLIKMQVNNEQQSKYVRRVCCIFIVMTFWSEVKDYLQSGHSNKSEVGRYKMKNKQYAALLEQPL